MTTSTDRAAEIAARMATLRLHTIRHTPYRAFEVAFADLVRRRRAELAQGPVEARGIALIGASGSGKTVALTRVVARMTQTLNLRPDEVVSFTVPSPASLKMVGHEALVALGYPLQANRTAAQIWQRVRDQLAANRTLVLILDEAQDLMRTDSPQERQAVVNTLKSLMQSRDCPVSLILAGVPHLNGAPGLLDLLGHDTQLSRRLAPIEFAPLPLGTSTRDLVGLVERYATRAGLRLAPDLLSAEFGARLCHAGAHQFGLVVELIIDAIERALNDQEPDDPLAIAPFAAAFRRRTGAIDALNPFLAEDYRQAEPHQVLAGWAQPT